MSIAVQAPAQAPSSSPSHDLIVGEPGSPVASGADPRFAQYKVIRRNGPVVAFEPSKITIAMTNGIGLGAFTNVIRPYPTQAEAIKAAAGLYTRTRLTPRVKRLFEAWLRLCR